MVREISKLIGRNATELRRTFMKSEVKDFREKELPINPNKGASTRQGFLMRRCFWKGFSKVLSIRNKIQCMDALESFAEKWEEAVLLPWAGAAELAAVAYAGCNCQQGYIS